MTGEEASFFALCDGEHALPLATAQDHKRAFDGDKGPNTGGMGSYSPAPVLTEGMCTRIMEEMVKPTLRAMKAMGCPYKGVLYVGVMVTQDGPKLVEYNARFGDPETQVLMPRISGDLLGALAAAASGDLSGTDLTLDDRAAVTVVLTSPDYPGRSDYPGLPITGLADAARTGALVFQGGTAARDGRVITRGGRILSVTATADTIPAARDRAYAAVDLVSFEGVRFRRDIAAGVAS
jgi:phosphoribosylamine--glycine ligase